MIPLKTAGIVRTTRGCNGGYFLNKEPKDITVLDLIELFEGECTLVDCVSDRKACPRTKNCLTVDVWRRISDSIRDSARKITLASILEQHEEKSLEYAI